MLPLQEARTEWRYDDYYHPRHGIAEERLPFFRLKFGKGFGAVWLYLSPYDGRILKRLDGLDRVERWLYHGLHSWDFAVLYTHPALWRSLVILLCMVGAGFSLTGVVLAFQLIRALGLARK